MGFFSIDSRFMRFMDKFVDVLLLNLVWLACSVPLITVGASTVAAFNVGLKLANNEDIPVFRTFFKAFKANFLQATGLWLINATGIYALYLDWQLISKSSEPSIWLIALGILTAALIFFGFLFAYPLLARYDNNLRNTIANSFKISLRYFGRTVVLILVVALELAVFMWNGVMQLFGVLIGPMILIYTVSGVSRAIFRDIDARNAAAPE